MAVVPFWVRVTSATANASTLVVQNSSAIQISFTNDDPNIPGVDSAGDLVLESTNGGIDPDTWVIINGVTYTFTYDVVGAFPSGNNKVPPALVGKQVAVIFANGTRYFFPLDGSGTQALMNAVGNGNIPLDNPVNDPPPFHVCFCAGTRIATPSGPVAVEALCAGDAVCVENGETATLLWTGSTRIGRDELEADPGLAPICIPAGSFGDHLPARDLCVSPQHRIVVENGICDMLFGHPRAFIAARHLVAGPADKVSTAEPVTYVHVLLADHRILFAEGLPCESFQPAGRTLALMRSEDRRDLERLLYGPRGLPLLTRPDALPTLTSHEARVYVARTWPGKRPDRVAPEARAISDRHAAEALSLAD